MKRGRRLIAPRLWLMALGHSVLFASVYYLAFALRFDLSLPPSMSEVFWRTIPWLLVVKLTLFYWSGHYHTWWTHVTFADLVALIRASVFSLLCVTALDHFFWSYQVPRVVLILDCTVLVVLLGALRASWRLFREQLRPIVSREDCGRALLVGASREHGILAHEIHAHGRLPYRIKGFLATKGEKTGARLGQIPVLGNLDEICKIAAAHRVKDVLVTSGILPGRQLRRLMETCLETGLNLRIIPALEDWLNGGRRIPVRDVEIDDLLRRDPVKLDVRAIAELLQGRTVMVTGAGGSIGSEICRQVLQFNPKALLLLGRGENRIFAIQRELQSSSTPVALHAWIADVGDRDRMWRLFEQHVPDVIFHAAAHKHVVLMENNAGEAVKNNVLATQRLVDFANRLGVSRFVFISTDKAVHPTSVMGATKQMAERYVLALSGVSPTRLVVVRFGNVLGSSGSVVPIFQEQIRNGGPITVTDARMKRYFMTIPEASQLVLQAAAMGRGGEIFVLKMGEPVGIVDLARDLVRLSGLPEDAIEIRITGIRPGEKLREQLYFDEEHTLPTPHSKLWVAHHRPCSLSEVREAISQLEPLIHGREETIRRKLREIVPDYRPSSPEWREEETVVAPAAKESLATETIP